MNPFDAPKSQPSADTVGRDRFWALSLAILSLFFCAPLTAPFAIHRAIRILRRDPDGIAIAAVVVAALGIASSLLLWFLVIWQFLTPATRPH